ncbi:MAG: cytochrome c [Anaerolineales bacterium]|nr:cytochrome c [Anaerolineales bacterium]
MRTGTQAASSRARHGVCWLALSLLVASCSISSSEIEAVTIQGTAVPPVPTLDVKRVQAGQELYTQYCAACHGLDLEGQLNWKLPKADGSYPAPPHNSQGHTWHHPDELLLEIIANGGDPALGATMPGFGEVLSEEQMGMILDFIKSHWGEEERQFQWWVTAR